MSEDYLIRNCAPTLAGIKTANLFTCPYESKAEIVDALCRLNRKLSPKGLRVLPLRFSEKKALIYLYRPKQLSADLAQAEAVRILQSLGYDCGGSERCLVQLAQKLRAQEEFPHEIGLFLGYPPGDVCGFMENKPCSCKCVGCWKVYTDEAGAKRKFDQYRMCTKIYCQQWANGIDIERLAVAG
ncbi:MAG: DUF3793 family protein [Eubacteriales bacterium]|nr:DUF3793 family protein [Eubacteriales bacterium]